MADYKSKSLEEKVVRLKDSVFAKTWVLYTGMPTSDVTLSSAKSANLWTGKLLIDEWDKLALVRNVGLDSMGVLNSTSMNLAASPSTPHHEGAGGEGDFVSKGESMESTSKRTRDGLVRKRKARKKNYGAVEKPGSQGNFKRE